jgi:hypothetical protein
MATRSLRARIDSIRKKYPTPKYRASHGQWTEPGWLVRGLVEAGHPVMESCRIIAGEQKLEPREAAIRGLRQSYYALRNRPWPEDH